MPPEKCPGIPCMSVVNLWGLVMFFCLPVLHCPGLINDAFGNDSNGGALMTIVLTSPAFSDANPIPAIHTCDGSDISPELSWANLPAGTRSLALIVDDPDAPDPRAPKMTWVHWVLYNIPAAAAGLAENAGSGDLPTGTMQGLNSWGRTGYGGPCPPIGRHRYFFKIYALDTVLPNLGRPGKDELLQSMESHILVKTELIGTYQR